MYLPDRNIKSEMYIFPLKHSKIIIETLITIALFTKQSCVYLINLLIKECVQFTMNQQRLYEVRVCLLL